MYVPSESSRITVRITTKQSKRKVKFLRRKTVREEGLKMSHSPTDMAAGWTFISSPSELNEEVQNMDATEDKSNQGESCVDTKKDANSDVDETEEAANPSGVEELDDDDLPSVSSESESLLSSDVDVLEESVGPDHDILQVSSSSHASTFSISSPLEGLPGFQHGGSVSTSSEFPEIKVDAVTNQHVACQSGEPAKSEVSSVKSPKSLAEAAASAQLVQSSNTPDNSSSSESTEVLQEHRQKSSHTPDNLSHSKSEEPLQEQRDKSSQAPDNLSCSKPEKPLQEQVSKQKPAVKKQRQQKVKKSRETSALTSFTTAIRDFVKDSSDELISMLGYLFLWLLTVLCFFWLLPSASDMGFLSINAAREMKYAQDETLKCLGLQHLTAVENNHYPMLLTNVCINDSAEWKKVFENLLKEKAVKNLMHNVYHESSVEKKTEIIEKFSSHTKTDMNGIRLDLLILQLEHLELIEPAEENAAAKKKQERSVIPDLLSEKLQEQEGILNQLHEFSEHLQIANFALKSLDAHLKMTDTDEKLTDPTALKPRVYRLELENAFLSYRLQHMLDEFENGEFLDPMYWLGSLNLNNALNHIGSNTMEELMEKVNYLLSANDEMKKLHSHFSVMKQHLKSDDKEINTGFSETQIDNLKSLVNELLGVHQSISGGLLEVKKWNEMLAAITSELRNAHEDVNAGYWNWSSFKRAFKGMFSDTQQNLADILKDIKHLDVSEFFSYTDEGKPFVKEMFESVSGFWKKTGTKSKEFFSKAFHELGTDFTRMFSPSGGRDDTHVESQELPENSEIGEEGVAESYSAREPNDSSGDQESGTSDYKGDWNKFKSDWLFQRAANREILRHTAKTKPMNWYLRRGHSMWHSPMTKEQEELLQKVEASSYPQHSKPYRKESKDQES